MLTVQFYFWNPNIELQGTVLTITQFVTSMASVYILELAYSSVHPLNFLFASDSYIYDSYIYDFYYDSDYHLVISILLNIQGIKLGTDLTSS